MGDNRIREWWVKCRRCGLEHRISNYGRRLAVRPDGSVVNTTVHEAGCSGWRLLSGRERTIYERYRELPKGVPRTSE
jgi:hypothetical protein